MRVTGKVLAASAAAVATCISAQATEHFDLRYSPGSGAADMSAPFERGWVFQSHAYIYSGNIRGTSTLTNDVSSVVGTPSGTAEAITSVSSNTQINVKGLLPRLSYMSSTTLLGATLGATMLVPVVTKESSVSIHGVGTTLYGAAASLPVSTQAAVINQIQARVQQLSDSVAALNSTSTWGPGDLEISPILRWSTDSSQTLILLTTVAPTGDYLSDRATNPGAGKFWTFRPAFQFGYIGDDWDAGVRAAYSFNTRNTATKYKSGNYLNLDFSLMKTVGESTRLGLTAFAMSQWERDSTRMTPFEVASHGAAFEAREDAALGQKAHVFGLGPDMAYIHGAGDYMLEARMVREFASQGRPRGFSAYLTLAKPF